MLLVCILREMIPFIEKSALVSLTMQGTENYIKKI